MELDDILKTVLAMKSDMDVEVVKITGGVKLDMNLEGFPP